MESILTNFTRVVFSHFTGICSIPDQETQVVISDGTAVRRPISLICDNIRDPANMAVLITSAVATSCDQLLITKGFNKDT